MLKKLLPILLLVSCGEYSQVRDQLTELSPLEVRASPAGGAITQPIDVEFYSSSENAIVYYTLDGSQPTTASKLYNSDIRVPITKTTILRYFAILERESSKLYLDDYVFIDAK